MHTDQVAFGNGGTRAFFFHAVLQARSGGLHALFGFVGFQPLFACGGSGFGFFGRGSLHFFGNGRHNGLRLFRRHFGRCAGHLVFNGGKKRVFVNGNAAFFQAGQIQLGRDFIAQHVA